jgi:probable addiction module antidote protein
MNDEYAPLDIASHLDGAEVIIEYLTAAAADDDPHVLLAAMADVAKSQGMEQVAAAALPGEGVPRLEAIRKFLLALIAESNRNLTAEYPTLADLILKAPFRAEDLVERRPARVLSADEA